MMWVIRIILAGGLATLLAVPAAVAAPLSIAELDAFLVAMDCHDRCRNQGGNVEPCLLSCPALDSAWNKDRDSEVTYRDKLLAVMEVGDSGQLVDICYEDPQETVVIPVVLCSAPDCTAGAEAEGCVDADGDGMAQWLETQLGTSDAVAEATCAGNRACDFRHTCTPYEQLADNLCRPRECDGPCLVFELNKTADNDQEVVVQVIYHHSPYPATVLDIKIEYSHSVLTLVDARPLPVLQAAGKELSTLFQADGTMRLVVLNTLSFAPIPFGPIVELVFSRNSSDPAQIGFSLSNFDQRYSMAPEQGDHVGELEDDTLWGSPIKLGTTSSSGPRLLLAYDFAKLSQPRSHPLASWSDSSASQICAVFAACNNETDDAAKSATVGRLVDLQGGYIGGGQSTRGVTGNALHFNGNADHLRLPWTLTTPPVAQSGSITPAFPTDQSFSLSMWFYSEGNSVNELPESPQLLFSHNHGLSETILFGLYLVPSQDVSEALDLVLYEGKHGAEGVASQTMAHGIELNKWRHLGLNVDAATGLVSAFLDGTELGERQLSHGAQTIGCPQFTPDGKGLRPHLQGEDDVGGPSSESVYLGVVRDGLHGIERMEPTGMRRSVVLRDKQYSYREPDFSSVTNRLVFSSNRSGSWEIWIAKATGEDPQPITEGFGDKDRALKARRPKWAPGGDGIIFESDIFSVGHNPYRTTQLYYVPYDVVQGAVAIPSGESQTTTKLVYDDIESRINQSQITSAQARNHTGALWLQGTHEIVGEPYLGEILLTTSDRTFANRAVKSIAFKRNGGALYADSPATPKSLEDLGGEFELLAVDLDSGRMLAKHSVKHDSDTVRRILLAQRDGGGATEVAFEGFLDSVSAATFGPGGFVAPHDQARVMVSGLNNARPILLHAKVNATGVVEEIHRVNEEYFRPAGMSWSAKEAYYPCNWIGGYREPTTGAMRFGFRGGVDELKLYSYLREAEEYLSESERGHERLAAAGEDGEPEELMPTCESGSHVDCPPFHICEEGICVVEDCDPSAGDPCADGLCVLRPSTVEDEEWDFETVCSVDCSVDAQCFAQECLNGPCRYCDDAIDSCIECQPREVEIGGHSFEIVEGCPDANSYECIEGSCVSECYAMDDGDSKFLCDSATHYCRRGRCELAEWDWTFLAPATLSGLGEMRFDGDEYVYTTAIPELFPIHIKAFGVGDRLHEPQILVEGRATAVNPANENGDWFPIGVITVYNRTAVQAEKLENTYTLTTRQHLTELRLRLYEPWSENVVAAKCRNDAEALANEESPPDDSECAWRPASSLAGLGYELGIPEATVWDACLAAGGTNCVEQPLEHRRYLAGGQASVIVLEVAFNSAPGPGLSIAGADNLICPYEGDTDNPLMSANPLVLRRLLYGGDLSKEQSNARNAYCAIAGSDCVPGDGLMSFPKLGTRSYGLLNCPFVHPSNPSQVAGLTFAGLMVLPQTQYGNITETDNSCTVETGTGSSIITSHCYEYMADVSFDPMHSKPVVHKSLEYGNFHSFAYPDSVGDEEPRP